MKDGIKVVVADWELDMVNRRDGAIPIGLRIHLFVRGKLHDAGIPLNFALVHDKMFYTLQHGKLDLLYNRERKQNEFYWSTNERPSGNANDSEPSDQGSSARDSFSKSLPCQ